MRIPATITQGDTVTWQEQPGRDSVGNQILPSEWALTWYFVGPTKLTVAATASASDWETTLTAAQTAALTPSDDYYWQAVATKASEKVTIGTGRLTVLQSLVAAGVGYDGRSQAQKDLDAVRAAIRARVSGGAVHEYMIGTRRLRNEPMAALLELESRLIAVVAKEKKAQSMANGLGDPRTMFVRFS